MQAKATAIEYQILGKLSIYKQSWAPAILGAVSRYFNASAFVTALIEIIPQYRGLAWALEYFEGF